MGNNNKNKNKGKDNIFANSDVMGREGLKFIKDMAFGNINQSTADLAFSNPDYVRILLQHVENLRKTIWYEYYAVNTVYGNLKDTYFQNIIKKHESKYNAYSTICGYLKLLITQNCTDYMRVLLSMQSNIKQYKYCI